MRLGDSRFDGKGAGITDDHSPILPLGFAFRALPENSAVNKKRRYYDEANAMLGFPQRSSDGFLWIALAAANYGLM